MNWLDRQLSPIREHRDRPAVVIDPEGLAPESLLADYGESRIATNWLELRRGWDLRVDAGHSGGRLVISLRSAEFKSQRDLPWDIEQGSVVAVVGCPVSESWRDVFLESTPDLAELLESMGRQIPAHQITTAFVRDAFSIVLPTTDQAAELEAIAKLRTNSATPSAIWPHIYPLLSGMLAKGLAETPPNARRLQAAWSAWLGGTAHEATSKLLAGAAGGILALLTAGILTPELATAPDLPSWTSVGSRAPDPANRVFELLHNPPLSLPPSTFPEWTATAFWWGEVRAGLSQVVSVPESLREKAELVWNELDGSFLQWLQTYMPSLMTSQRGYPVTVSQIAPFLARRRNLKGGRYLLLVLDGMGMAQWSVIRKHLSVDVLEAVGTLAMCPTLTSVSRQAIFAGAWPRDFADSLWTTSKEATRWYTFWTANGLARSQVRYERTDGRDAKQVPELGDELILGIVVNAVDDLLHGADVLGDAQVTASTELWLKHEFLSELIRRASSAGFDIWLTADHGNLESAGGGYVSEGARIEQAGTRVRMYDNQVLRDMSHAEGIPWDPPGHPDKRRSFLFAPKRHGYHAGGTRVSHGGLSLDEVIVPFVRIAAR